MTRICEQLLRAAGRTCASASHWLCSATCTTPWIAKWEVDCETWPTLARPVSLLLSSGCTCQAPAAAFHQPWHAVAQLDQGCASLRALLTWRSYQAACTGLVCLNAAVVPRVGVVSTAVELVSPASEDEGLLEAACGASTSAARAERPSNGQPARRLEARHFLAVELQEGAVRQAGHVWVHVPDSLARDRDSSPHVSVEGAEASVVSIEPLLRTLPSEPGALTRQVFLAHHGFWSSEVTTSADQQCTAAA